MQNKGENVKQSTVAIIGAGAVGATTAYTCIMQLAAKIMLVDINVQRCAGEVDDLADALSFGSASEIMQGTLQEAGQADIIIIAAGVPQKPGQSRLELLTTNKKVIASILTEMQPINKQSVIIVVTNPVDILTRLVQELSGLPRNQVFGSGTLLDTQRLRGLISKKIQVDPRSIHLYVLGEHGDSQCVAWSSADVGGSSLLQFPQLTQKELDAMAVQARQKAYDIIACKGSTSFGIAACVAAYCQNILLDQKRIVPVSCFVESLGVCLSMPAVLGRNGIEQILNIPLDATERAALEQSAHVVQSMYEQMN